LSAAGVRAALATKPHLQSYRERVRVDGVAIAEATLERAIGNLRPLVAELGRRLPRAGSPTTFELTAVLALSHFAEQRCEVAVVEVGLGGKYDATNATDPHVSVITAISHDHTRELGSTLRKIATEKAGVIRPGRIVVIAPQPRDARTAILAACARTAAVPREVEALTARVASRDGLALRGAHQRANAAAAVAAANALAEHGVSLTKGAIGRGLHALRWPGRFETVPGTPVIVLDGAHNDGSAVALARTLRHEYPRRPVRFVIGLMQEKDARAVLRPLLPLASAVEATRSRSPRALEPAALARGIRGVPVRTHSDLPTALRMARAAADSDEIICVTGSLALVGEARDALGLAIGEQLWAGAQ
jgi:dihydrofolate synthase/folylpolyglutamate synthase